MKDTIRKYGWIVAVVIIISILISTARFVADYLGNRFDDIMPGEQDYVIPYTVTLVSNNSNAGTVKFVQGYSGTKVRLEGEQTITISAVCHNGFNFLGWYKGNKLISKELTCTLQVNNSQTITGCFAKSFGLYKTDSKYTDLICGWQELIDKGILSNVGQVVPGKESLLTGELVVDQSVISIPENAYFMCVGLTDVVVPTGVTKIEASAFNSCTRMEYINIPSGIEYIGDAAFNSCLSLTEITIPNTVSFIGKYAFAVCVNLEKVAFEKDTNLKAISAYMFNGCLELKKATLAAGITSIEEFAFANCESLSEVTIPSTVERIGDNIFYRCSSLKAIYFDGTIAQWNAIQFGDNWEPDVDKYTVVCTNGIIEK